MHIINMNIIVKEHNSLVDANGDRMHKIYIRFQSENQVNQFTKHRSFKVNGKEFEVFRLNPKDIYMFGQITCFLSFELRELGWNVSFQQKLTEYDMQKYFNRFGAIIGCDHPNDHECILQFQELDLS